MAIGGFNGGDPAPTLAEFKALVAAGDIHWFVVGGEGGLGGPQGGVAPPSGGGGAPPSGGFGGPAAGPRGDRGTGNEIAAWVAENFGATTVAGTTVYDLTTPTGGTSAAVPS
jgi:hypothetical protein